MRYSLLNHFQGTFVGSLIGANLGNPLKPSLWWLSLSQAIIKKLAQTGEISSEDWLAIASDESCFPEDSQVPNTGELILGTLPLMVFFHDAPSLLWEQLQGLVVQWQLPPDTLEEMMIWGELLTLIFRETVKVQEIISQLLTYDCSSDSSLRESLKQIESFVQLETPLRQVINHFARHNPPEHSAIPLAVYCFSSTPEDFSLGVLRAFQTNSPVITALVGALAGAYNSCLGIPSHWQIALRNIENSQLINQTIPTLWTMWIGSNTLGKTKLDGNMTAVNSPLVMQKRSSVTLISQKEYLRLTPLFDRNSKVVTGVNH